MTHQEIIEKVIKKANIPLVVKVDPHGNHSFFFQVIFSHPFAKAFWGRKKECGYCKKEHKGMDIDIPWYQEAWEFHLQQMVLEKDPIKYLEQFL